MDSHPVCINSIEQSGGDSILVEILNPPSALPKQKPMLCTFCFGTFKERETVNVQMLTFCGRTFIRVEHLACTHDRYELYDAWLDPDSPGVTSVVYTRCPFHHPD